MVAHLAAGVVAIQAGATFGIGIGIFEIETETGIVTFETSGMVHRHFDGITIANGFAVTASSIQEMQEAVSGAVDRVHRRLCATFAIQGTPRAEISIWFACVETLVTALIQHPHCKTVPRLQ